MSLEIIYNQKTLHDSTRASTKSYSHAVHLNSFRTSAVKAEHPVIPSRNIFEQIAKPVSQTNALLASLPNVAECAVHLELLQALYALRQNVLRSQALDNAFDIKPNTRTVWRGYRPRRYQVKIKDTTFASRRLEKWPIFVNFAVLRFMHWAKSADAALYGVPSDSRADKIEVPPLDILMVWHTSLLNPKDFRLYCSKQGLLNIRAVRFPWAKIHNSIDSEDWSFNLLDNAATNFKELTGLEPDLLPYLVKTSKTDVARDIVSHWSSIPLSFEQSERYVKAAAKHKIGSKAYLLECGRSANGKRAVSQEMASAVNRQASFVDKMERYLWIRSPALPETLQRAIDRYSKFIKLFKLYPKILLVPTLDVDLVWHTHQCSASHYQADVESYTNQYIGHNDKLGDSVLGDGMEKTTKLFRIRFGQEYSVCLCWDCEAALSEVKKIEPDKMTEERIQSAVERVSLLVAFYRQVEVARRGNKPYVPVWDVSVHGLDYC